MKTLKTWLRIEINQLTISHPWRETKLNSKESIHDPNEIRDFLRVIIKVIMRIKFVEVLNHCLNSYCIVNVFGFEEDDEITAIVISLVDRTYQPKMENLNRIFKWKIKGSLEAKRKVDRSWVSIDRNWRTITEVEQSFKYMN